MYCYVEPPAGVQPEQPHTNMINSQKLITGDCFSHIEAEKSLYADWYSFALTQIMFSQAVWQERSSVYLGIREGVLEKRWQPWQQCEEGAGGAQVCNDDGTEKQTQPVRQDTEGVLSHFSLR